MTLIDPELKPSAYVKARRNLIVHPAKGIAVSKSTYKPTLGWLRRKGEEGIFRKKINSKALNGLSNQVRQLSVKPTLHIFVL